MEGERSLVLESLLLPCELSVAPVRVPTRTPNSQARSVSEAKDGRSMKPPVRAHSASEGTGMAHQSNSADTVRTEAAKANEAPKTA